MTERTAYVEIDYTNWRGERRVRRVEPLYIVWETENHWHPQPQWLLYAEDADGARKAFAMNNIHSWKQVAP